MPNGTEQTSGLIVRALVDDTALIALFGRANNNPTIFYQTVPPNEIYPWIFIQRSDSVTLNPTSENNLCHTQEEFTFVAFWDNPDSVWDMGVRIQTLLVPDNEGPLPAPLTGGDYQFTTRVTSPLTSTKTPFKSQRRLDVYQAALSILFSSNKLGGV